MLGGLLTTFGCGCYCSPLSGLSASYGQDSHSGEKGCPSLCGRQHPAVSCSNAARVSRQPGVESRTMGHSISSLRGRVRPAIATRLAALLAGGLLAACGSKWSAGSASKTLTIWQSWSPGENGLGFIYPAAKAFEKANPGVKINIVVKPPDNYFALLQAAMLGHTGPDIAEIYPGTYVRNTIPYFVNLNSYVPASTRQSVTGIKYYSKTGNPNSNTYGFPQKINSTTCGTTRHCLRTPESRLTDFSQMATDCRLLKAKGITPLVDGNPTFTTPAMGPTPGLELSSSGHLFA